MRVVAILTSVLVLGTALPASGRPSVTDSPSPAPSAAQSTAQQATDETASPAHTAVPDEPPERSESAEGTPDATTTSPETPAASADAGEGPGATPDAPALEQTPTDLAEEETEEASDDEISILALGPDGAQPPYVYWTATDATGARMGGATFEIQGPLSGSSWGSQATVADCTTTPCTGPDLDPDAGEFLVKSLDSHNLTASSRYRVRQLSAPAGYDMRNTDYRELPGTSNPPQSGAWVNETYNFGAFVNDQQTTIPQCTAGYVYGVSAAGQIRQVAPDGWVTNLGSPAARVSSFNGLGIGSGGSTVFGYERSGLSSNQIAIWRYDTSTGQWTATGHSINSNTDSRTVTFVAGGVDLLTGKYYVGGFGSNGTRFRLWQYDPATNGSVYKGEIDTSSGAGGATNGDLAFDAQGNLFVIRGSGTSTTVFSVTDENLAAANGGTIPASLANTVTTMDSVNGVAFDSSGKAFLGSGSVLRSYNMPGWSNSTNVVSSGLNSTDLATCSSPPTITIEKYIEGGRVNVTDQFKLILQQGTVTIGETTTSGTAAGLQSQRIGPIPTVRNVPLTFTEVGTGTPAANLASYASSYRCEVDGVFDPQASGSGTTGTITIPANGQAVVCQFHNSPLVATVNINKVELDADGLNLQPGSDWTVGAAASATTGTATLSPSASTQQTNASGSATWKINFNAVNARTTINVSETQQPGYAFVDGECTVTPLGGDPGDPISLPSEAGTAIPGVAPGDTVDCTFTNKLSPTTLTLAKEVWFGDADPSEWTLQATGPSGSLPGPNGTTGTADATAEITPGVAYTLSESGGPDTYVADGDWVCLTDIGDPVTVTDGQVALASGDQVTCTISNATAQLTLLKHVEDPALDPSDWELTAEPEQVTGLNLGTETVVGAGTASDENTFYVRPNHSYTISEELAAQPGTIAFRALGIEKLVQGEWVAIDSDEITLEPGEQATYRFVNDSLPEIILPLTGGLASDTFLIAGGGVLLLALALAAAQRRRRNEVHP